MVLKRKGIDNPNRNRKISEAESYQELLLQKIIKRLKVETTDFNIKLNMI